MSMKNVCNRMCKGCGRKELLIVQLLSIIGRAYSRPITRFGQFDRSCLDHRLPSCQHLVVRWSRRQ